MTYYERNQFLRSLGYSSYHDYRQSLRWAQIRARIMPHGTKCHTCQFPATEVHHSPYSQENLSGKSLDGLFPLCFACHELIEKDTGAKILDTKQIADRFAILQQHGYKRALLSLEGHEIRPSLPESRTREAPRTGLAFPTSLVTPRKTYVSKWKRGK